MLIYRTLEVNFQTPQLGGHSSPPWSSHQTNFFQASWPLSIALCPQWKYSWVWKRLVSHRCASFNHKNTNRFCCLVSLVRRRSVDLQSQTFAEGQQTVRFCGSYLVQRVVCWFISLIFAFWLCAYGTIRAGGCHLRHRLWHLDFILVFCFLI